MTPARFSNRPLYLQLRDALIERITTGHWQPGAVLPNETDLAHEFGVSPGTMRKALDVLEAEHLITRRQGRGTFVNDPTSEKLAVRFSNIRDASGQRIAGLSETGETARGVATDVEQQRLQLQPKEEVYRVRRYRYHEERVYMVEDASLPCSLFGDLPETIELSGRIVVFAHHHSLLLGKAEERVVISTPGRGIAERLGLPARAPLMTLDRVVFALDGRPVEWRVGYCHLVDEYYAAEMA
jgi:GntR family transcriptional regulator